MSSKSTQQARILGVLKSLQTGDHDIPEEFLRRHPTGDGISAGYLKRVLGISECNGRISELRGKGYEIETSAQKDEHGFADHRLKPEGAAMTRADHLKIAAEAVREFDKSYSASASALRQEAPDKDPRDQILHLGAS